MYITSILYCVSMCSGWVWEQSLCLDFLSYLCPYGRITLWSRKLTPTCTFRWSSFTRTWLHALTLFLDPDTLDWDMGRLLSQSILAVVSVNTTVKRLFCLSKNPREIVQSKWEGSSSFAPRPTSAPVRFLVHFVSQLGLSCTFTLKS